MPDRAACQIIKQWLYYSMAIIRFWVIDHWEYIEAMIER